MRKLGLIHLLVLLVPSIALHLMLWMERDPDSRRFEFLIPFTFGYTCFLSIVSSVLLSLVNDHRFKLRQALWKAWRPIFEWHGWILLFEFIGATLGVIAYVSIGTLFNIGDSISTRAYNGLVDGLFYFLIWGPGLSVVIVIIRSVNKARLQATTNLNNP